MRGPAWVRWTVAVALVLAVAVGGALANMALLSGSDPEPAVGSLNARERAPVATSTGAPVSTPTTGRTTADPATTTTTGPRATTAGDDDPVRTDDRRDDDAGDDDAGDRDAHGDRIDSDLRPDDDGDDD